MFISVIIPAKNEEKLLPKTLAALKCQSYDSEKYEIIVVDNGSTDRTVQLAEASGAKVLSYPGLKVGAMRNRGTEIARGDVFGFIDADCVAAPDWLTRISEIYSKERCVTGSECEIAEDDSWIAKTWFCLQPLERGPVKCLATNNMVVDRVTFEKIRGFDESLVSGEDCEFCSRAATIVPVLTDPSLKVIHLGTPKNLLQFLRREIWHGIGAFGTFRHNKFDKPLIGTFAFLFSVALFCLGLFINLYHGSGRGIMLSAFCLLCALIAMTLSYRAKFIRDRKHALSLAVLYVLFYLGRSIALFLALFGKNVYHNNRAS